MLDLDDMKPGPDARLEEKLEWIDKHRPPIQRLPHSGPCDWRDVPVASRQLNAKPDPNGNWFRRECRLCGRFYGFGVRDNK